LELSDGELTYPWHIKFIGKAYEQKDLLSNFDIIEVLGVNWEKRQNYGIIEITDIKLIKKYDKKIGSPYYI